jgi:CRP-like cAMP-binding protein
MTCVPRTKHGGATLTLVPTDSTSVAHRVLALTRVSPYDMLPPAELPLIALASREKAFATRSVLVRAGERPEALHVPLRGMLGLSLAGRDWSGPANPAHLAGLALLGRIPLPADLVATAGTVVLVVDLDALHAVLEEHGQLCRHLLRALAWQLRTRRQSSGSISRRFSGPLPAATDFVSRMFVLQETIGLGIEATTVMARLARVARELGLAPGMTLIPSARDADVLIVTRGALRLVRRDGTPRLARAGEVVGLLEAVAGIPLAERATATVPTSILNIAQAELSSAIEDDDLLCLQLIRAFAAELSAHLTARALEGVRRGTT